MIVDVDPNRFLCVAAIDELSGIARDGKMAWHLPEELKFFSRLTGGRIGQKSAVIMGRKTWDSLPENYRPLPDRTNIVLSRNEEWRRAFNKEHFCHFQNGDEVKAASDLDQAFRLTDSHRIHRVFVIGGLEIYRLALNHARFGGFVVSKLLGDYECDRFFPELLATDYWTPFFLQKGKGYSSYLYLKR